MTKHWIFGAPTSRTTPLSLGAVFAILAGYYMSSSDIQCASWLVRAASVQQPSIEAKSDLTDADHDGVELLDARQETKHSPNGGPIGGHEIESFDFVEDELHKVDEKQPVPDCKEPRSQVDAIENEHMHSKSELERRIVTYQTEIAALESKFLTEYGLLEDEIEELRTNNKVLRGDIAQASANVEGVKMQMEAAAETANDVKLKLLGKLESEQTEYNRLEDDRDYLTEALNALSNDLTISKEGRKALQKENRELKELLPRHKGRQCGCASTDQSQEADSTTMEAQRLRNVQMEFNGGERGSEDPLDPGIMAIEFRNLETDGATIPSRFNSNASIQLRGHPPFTEQGYDRRNTRHGPQDRLVRHIGKFGSVTGDEGLENHPLPTLHPLKLFQEKVDEIQDVLDECKSNDSGFCPTTSLSKLLAETDDLLHQMSFNDEDRSWNDDTLLDMPAHSTTESILGDVSGQESHDTGDNDVSIKEQHDTQNLVGGALLSDVVGGTEKGESATSSRAEFDDRESDSPPAAAIVDDIRSIDNSKSSKMRRWSSQSKAFLAGLHRSRASIDRRESSLRTSSSDPVSEELEH